MAAAGDVGVCGENESDGSWGQQLAVSWQGRIESGGEWCGAVPGRGCCEDESVRVKEGVTDVFGRNGLGVCVIF